MIMDIYRSKPDDDDLADRGRCGREQSPAERNDSPALRCTIGKQVHRVGTAGGSSGHQRADNLQHTAQHYAGEGEYSEIVEILLVAGAEG